MSRFLVTSMCAWLRVRMVPPSVTSLGMTLYASPACIIVTDTTAESSGEVPRDTSVCAAPTMALAATTGSLSLWGIAAWPPCPRTVILKEVAPAMMAPARLANLPESSQGHTCMAKTASTPSMTPSCTITSAPAPPSSAGWNSSLTVPGSVASCSLRILAAPSSMAMCASCPHACMTPGFWLLYSTSLSSRMGSASMSARRATVGPEPVPMVPTIPSPAKGYW
mmetsp:Transcript_35958/g.91910  ORF Transcript_35958/g.91910 Transcript_35958/m.91910 type:complete len:223 (+) Transcript_35958:470-1138(+)